MKYKLQVLEVSEIDINKINYSFKQLIDDYWEPYGTLTITKVESHYYISQGFIKQDDGKVCKHYLILSDYSAEGLSEKVNLCLREEYTPFGTHIIDISNQPDKPVFFQAVVLWV